MGLFRALGRLVIGVPLSILALAVIAAGAFVALFRRRGSGDPPRLLWGTQPINSLTRLSRAMRAAGHESETVALDEYAIFDLDEFDHLPFPKRGNALVRYAGGILLASVFFARALGRFDVFHYFCEGGVLRSTPLARLEFPLLKALGKRIVLLPYGGDAFVYDQIPNVLWRHALMIEYAYLGDEAEQIQSRLRRLTRRADCVVGSLVHVTCMPRWDVLPLTAYPVDTEALEPRWPRTDGPVAIAHAANHRGAKGTEFLIDAVEALRAEGVEIELDLIERVPNEEAIERISRADVYVDQLVFGYAMAALEGMALGKVVVSGLEDTPDYRLFRRYSYLDECPIVPASPETATEVLRGLIERRRSWPEIGRESRAYVERRHSPRAARELYGAIYRRIWHREELDLMDLFNRRTGTAARTGGGPAA